MSNDSAATRWWENYLVRYFLPSLAGMVIVRWLDISVKDSIGNYIPTFLLTDWKDFGTAHLVIWLLFGSLYCYIASYPILVFHSTRVLDFVDRKGTMGNNWLNPYGHSIIFAVLAYISAWKDMLWLAVVAVVIFSAIQLIRLYKVYARQELFGFKQGYEASVAYAYLNRLSKRRGVKAEKSAWEDDEGNSGEVINSRLVDLAESYKHLREHGNTAFIFLLELALCPIFFVALKHQKGGVDFGYVAILVLVWIVPAALVHLLGQHLERRYSLFHH
ncbi:hypothetical protein QZM28_22190 [Burkholderia multivorans]|nr:hypothetical protein [Burkholderia multivorans]